MISFIVAMDEKGAIGKNNSIPWYLPDDLKRFKRITMGHEIVMGRKTFESIGRALPGRKNIILSANPKFQCEQCTIFREQEKLLDYCLNKNEEIFIIGGAVIFQILIPYVEKLYITKIYHSFNGDVFFPDINWSDFTIIYKEEKKQNKHNQFQHEFIIYSRK